MEVGFAVAVGIRVGIIVGLLGKVGFVVAVGKCSIEVEDSAGVSDGVGT
jgi:hypothetical protein